MKNRRLIAGVLAIVAWIVISTTGAAGSPPPAKEAARADCALSNPAYSGWCRQSVPVPSGSTPQKACEAVLSCLNGNACAANYCNAPNIRGGWKLEEAKPSRPAAPPR